ncbi:hypothetical protein LPJ78_004346 [Coemansia sp. RSA 989]|nr:hypothetical protein LPJ78_004346 [Coemansia sp. RSA 989]
MVRLSYGLGGLSLLLGVVASADSDERVIGGVKAPEGMFPFMVHLFKDGSPYCGGTLIDAEWVVTAAHCVAKSDGSNSGAGSFITTNPGSFKVGYGTNSGGLEDYVEVDSIVVSTGFDPVWYTSDIALVKIKSNNNLITKAKTITVSGANISEGQTVITAGWGQTSNSNTDQSNSLMYAGLVVEKDDICRAGAVDWNGQNGRYVCTSFSTAPGIGTCFGDSGGPLLLNTGGGYTFLGIVSFDVNTKDSSNTRCAQDGNISYFTRVSSYIPFISSVTGISESVLLGASSPWSHNAATSESSTSSSSSSSSNSSSSSSSSSSSNDNSNDSKNDSGDNDNDNDNDNDKDKDKDKDNEPDEDDKPEDSKGNDNGQEDGKTTEKSSTISDKPTDSDTDEHDELQEHVDSTDKSDESSDDSKSQSITSDASRWSPALLAAFVLGSIASLF